MNLVGIGNQTSIQSKIETAVDLAGIHKSFGATPALQNASVKLRRGEVHALLGENGAGKSTMVKILSGLVRPDSGQIRVNGAEVVLRSPRDAHRCGIQTAFQELTLVPDLTISQNMLLPYQPVGFGGQIRERHGADLVAGHMRRMGLDHIDVRREVRELPLATRQKIEIARAIFRKPRILLLDEPTASLSGSDIDWLGRLIDEIRADGATIVLITHRIPEVRRFCDRMTVLRNGKVVGDYTPSEVSDDQVIEIIIGRSLSATFPAKKLLPRGDRPMLAAQGLATADGLVDATLELHQGEIVGVGGLQGMGQQELFRALFGASPLTAGQIKVNGRDVTLTSPRDAIDARVGISLVPEERKTEGLFLRLDGRRNVSVAVLDRFTWAGVIRGQQEETAVSAMLGRVEVAQRALYTRLEAFSGGNQQKVAIAKWLMTSARILLMVDPTRGVDVGTKHEIYLIMQDFVAAGGTILFFSTEIEELVNLSHRVLVMYKGRIAVRLDDPNEITESAIMRFALGVESGPSRSEKQSAANQGEQQ